MALYRKHLTSYQQNTHIEIMMYSGPSITIVLCERARKIYAKPFLNFKPAMNKKISENFAIFKWNYQFFAEKIACIAHF